MPPSLALIATLAFVLFLFVWDGQRKEPVSPALWLPVLWMVVTGSRFLSQWLDTQGPSSSFTTEGSPLDAAYFLLLIFGGTGVLIKRHMALGTVIRQNAWLFVFVVYGLLAIVWSDFPFVAFKRWVKTLGHPIMALVILTDPDPAQAFRVVMKRCAFVLMPFSVMLIKYFPDIGRSFESYSGLPANNGVGLTKNDLGYLCMIFGLFFAWDLAIGRTLVDGHRRRDATVAVLFLAMILWLLRGAASATANATLTLGLLALFLGGRRIIYRHLPGMVVLAILLFVTSEYTLDIYSRVLDFLGRDPSLTDRTQLWDDVISLQTNPLFGQGFESFWLGDRAALLAQEWWWHPNQAHNGYIETYLNLGYVGVILLAGIIVSTFRKINRELSVDVGIARLWLAYFVAILAFNYTEAAFKGVHLVLTIFYIITLRYERPAVARADAAPDGARTRILPARLGKRAMHGSGVV